GSRGWGWGWGGSGATWANSSGRRRAAPALQGGGGVEPGGGGQIQLRDPLEAAGVPGEVVLDTAQDQRAAQAGRLRLDLIGGQPQRAHHAANGGGRGGGATPPS